ncbi:hypothetical protein R1sor_024595 [Riccia sorocarpa]|uniref:SET domain-containing protein n=1 Tax=Riccia sorocarpa TaxID=122646 RepID=A0ABD3GUY1_9MARC
MVAKAEQLRLEGKNLFESGRWTEAAGVYGQCIDVLLKKGGDPEQLVVAYSNRAETLLQLRKYADALEDAEEALDLDPLHLKSLARKARALFGLKLYKEPEWATSIFDLCTCDEEQCEPCDSPRELEDFVGPVQFKRTPGLDRGLFATRDLKPGEILFVAAPLASVIYPKVPNGRVASISTLRLMRNLDEMVKHARSNLKDFSQVQFLVQLEALAGPYATGPLSVDTPPIKYLKPVNSIESGLRQLSAKELQHPRFRTEYDEDTLFDIVRRRQYILSGVRNKMERIVGIYTLPTLINHSCFPNVSFTTCGTNARASLVFRATREIKKGDQLFSSYQLPFCPLEDRSLLLQGFNCRCERCALEGSLLREIPSLRRLESRCSRLHVGRLGEYSRSRSYEERAEMRRQSIQTIEAVNELFRTEPKLRHLTAIQKDWVRGSFIFPYSYLHDSLAPNASKEDLLDQLRWVLEAVRIIRSIEPASDLAIKMLTQAQRQTITWKMQARSSCEEIEILLKELGTESLGMAPIVLGAQLFARLCPRFCE